MNLLPNVIKSSLQQKVLLEELFVFLTSYITVVLGVMQISLIRHSILPAAHFSTLCAHCALSPPLPWQVVSSHRSLSAEGEGGGGTYCQPLPIPYAEVLYTGFAWRGIL